MNIKNDTLLDNTTCESVLAACHIIEGFSLHFLFCSSLPLRKMAFINLRDCDQIISRLELNVFILFIKFF